MNKYHFADSYSVYYTIEANSLEEAKAIADDRQIDLSDAEFVDTDCYDIEMDAVPDPAPPEEEENMTWT